MACAYASRFLSRSFEERLQQTERRLQLWHLRQEGSIADFNYAFDSLSANLDVPEDYLVEAYVSGLKEEVAESVKLFNPLTMREAQSLARVQEISLQWRAKKAEQARKGLEYQSKTLFVKNETQEVLPDMQEPSIAQETEDDAQEVYAFLGKKESCSDSSQECNGIREETEVIELEGRNDGRKTCSGFLGSMMGLSHATKENKDANMNSGMGELSMPEFESHFHTPETWKNAKMASGVSGSFSLVCFLPLSSFSSSLALFLLFGRRTLSSNSYANVSKSMEPGLWSVQQCTWLTKDDLEQSNMQLDATLFKLQNYFGGLQLDSISSLCQEYFGDTLGLALSDQNVGFNFQENGPSSLQQWVNSAKPIYMSIRWSFHVKLSCTRTLLQLWFKGKLIVMLYGRFCSLRGKTRKCLKGEMCSRIKHNLKEKAADSLIPSHKTFTS